MVVGRFPCGFPFCQPEQLPRRITHQDFCHFSGGGRGLQRGRPEGMEGSDFAGMRGLSKDEFGCFFGVSHTLSARSFVQVSFSTPKAGPSFLFGHSLGTSPSVCQATVCGPTTLTNHTARGRNCIRWMCHFVYPVWVGLTARVL